jgi:glycosyltransferase involved in cell wall biosynthesis
MLCGTPVVASNLPGVRQPVLQTGMGKIIPIADAAALAEAVLEILDQPSKFQADRESIAARYAPAAAAEAYERAFTELLRGQ